MQGSDAPHHILHLAAENRDVQRLDYSRRDWEEAGYIHQLRMADDHRSYDLRYAVCLGATWLWWDEQRA